MSEMGDREHLTGTEREGLEPVNGQLKISQGN